jgi:predicted cupin superfamily sugar epimerase
MRRIEILKQELNLEPHPEGGYYREMVRSNQQVQQGERTRSAGTAIYFLVPEGQLTSWHNVASDEVWHYYEGDPLVLEWLDAAGSFHRSILGPTEEGQRPQHLIPAGCWQRAYCTGSFTLCGCTVSPGFEFEDFTMLDPADLAKHFPDHKEVIQNNPIAE